MSRAQIVALLVTTALSSLDGYDILSITFAAPDIARVFGMGKAAIGLLLSSGLAGMLLGALFLAPVADIIGRRRMVLICLAIMATGMLLTALSRTAIELIVIRTITGIGIGGMIVILNPLAVEYANLRHRAPAVAIMSIGYPIGGTVGGFVAALLLRSFDWRAVFLFGAALTLLLVPVVVLLLPESLAFLMSRRDERSLDRVNALLGRCGHAPVVELPPADPVRASPYQLILSGTQLLPTVRIAMVMFLYVSTVYFFQSWSPLMVVDAGFSTSTAALVAGINSLAGLVGCILFGILSNLVRVRLLTLISMIGIGVATALFGSIPHSFAMLAVVAAMAGLFLNAGTVGLYTTIADTFAPHIRATGTGFAIGIGRAGSALGPAVAGILFAVTGNRGEVSAVMTLGAILAAVLLLLPLPAGSPAV